MGPPPTYAPKVSASAKKYVVKREKVVRVKVSHGWARGGAKLRFGVDKKMGFYAF